MSENKRSETTPKVSVLMITYNHEKYIEEAVRSVMMQETDFDYELIIGEDCSTDNTREIVLRLKDEFPDKIRLILHQENVGMIPNFIDVYNAATGEYIALCEGDDYWTDPKKLQLQVDFLENNPSIRICSHPVQILREHGSSGEEIKTCPENDFDDVQSVYNRMRPTSYTQTSAILFYRLEDSLPPWFGKLRTAGDWPLIIWLLAKGEKIACIKGEPLSIYRKHEHGITNPQVPIIRQEESHRDILWVRSSLKPILSRKHFRKIFNNMLARSHKGLCIAFLEQNNVTLARHHLWKYVYYTNKWRQSKTMLLLLCYCYLPKRFQIL